MVSWTREAVGDQDGRDVEKLVRSKARLPDLPHWVPAPFPASSRLRRPACASVSPMNRGFCEGKASGLTASERWKAGGQAQNFLRSPSWFISSRKSICGLCSSNPGPGMRGGLPPKLYIIQFQSWHLQPCFIPAWGLWLSQGPFCSPLSSKSSMWGQLRPARAPEGGRPTSPWRALGPEDSGASVSLW